MNLQEIKNQVSSQVASQVLNQVRNQVSRQVWIRMAGQVRREVLNRIR